MKRDDSSRNSRVDVASAIDNFAEDREEVSGSVTNWHAVGFRCLYKRRRGSNSSVSGAFRL